MADGYTRTGNNIFSRFSRFLSYIPFFGPMGGWMVTLSSGLVGAAVDSIGWLARGNLWSAITAFGAGAAEAAVNTAATSWGGSSGQLLYWGNMVAGMATDGGLGRHARALTETVVNGVSSPLGMQPTVLKSYYAGIGSIDGYASTGPGYWATKMTPDGQNAQAYYAAKMNGEAMSQHAAELESARGMPNYRSV